MLVLPASQMWWEFYSTGAKVLNHPELINTKATEYMSHEEKYRYNLSRAIVVLKLINDEGMDVNEIRCARMADCSLPACQPTLMSRQL